MADPRQSDKASPFLRERLKCHKKDSTVAALLPYRPRGNAPRHHPARETNLELRRDGAPVGRNGLPAKRLGAQLSWHEVQDDRFPLPPGLRTAARHSSRVFSSSGTKRNTVPSFLTASMQRAWVRNGHDTKRRA